MDAHWWSRWLGRLSVGHKLALIYLLGLAAVIFVAALVIEQDGEEIERARLEIDGVARLRALEMPFADSRPAAPDEWRAQVHRIAVEAQLKIDPAADTDALMTLLVQHYPDLLVLAREIEALMESPVAHADPALRRTAYLVLDGRLVALSQAINEELAAAYAASGPALKEALLAYDDSLYERIDSLRVVALAFCDGTEEAPLVHRASAQLVAAIDPAWDAGIEQLDRLLHERVQDLQGHLALHLGSSLATLGVVLGLVIAVARQISVPLKRLAAAADRVRRTGDHAQRVHWHSRDEIGMLVDGFHAMLSQLERERELQKDYAARARAAQVEQELVEATPTPLVVTTLAGARVLHANPPGQRWLAEAQGDPWRHGLEPQVRERFFGELATTGHVEEFEALWRSGDSASWTMLSASRVRFQGQDAVIAAFAPINRLKLLERRLALWGRVFEASAESIVVVDAERRIHLANPAFHQATGFAAEAVLGESPRMLLARRDAAGALDPIWREVAERGQWQGELRLARADGSAYPAWLMASAVREDEQVTHVILTSLDITDRKESEQRIRFLAEHDPLTQLPNRALFLARLEMAMQQARRNGTRVALLFVDLDRFKPINDRLGHHVGDELLRSVAQRLLASVREVDTVARIGGDEFVVILEGVIDAAEARQVAERRLIPQVRAPHRIEGHELRVSCSVGGALFPDHADDVDELIRLADTAMYRAKGEGRDGARFYEPALAEAAVL